MNEVISTVSFFLRLITYNKMVFNEHYDRILSQFQWADHLSGGVFFLLIMKKWSEKVYKNLK